MGNGRDNDRWQVLELIAAEHPLEEVLAHLTRSVADAQPGVAACALMLRGGDLDPAAHSGAEASPHGAIRDFWQVAATDGVRLLAALGSQSADDPDAVASGDIASDPAWAELQLRPAALQHGFTCWFFAPFPSEDGVPPGALLALGAAGVDPRSDAVRVAARTAARLAGLAVRHRQMAAQVDHRARHDALTALPNRVLFDDRLEQAIARAARRNEQVGLLLMNLDRFRLINDTLGPHVGDAVLQQVAARWRDVCRQADTLVRMGGDEFGVVSPDLTDRRDVARVAGRLLEALAVPIQAGGQVLYVTASIGMAVFPDDARDPASLQQCADVALARAKKTGRNRFQCFAPEMNTAALERLELESQLRQAVGNNELRLQYQPKFDLRGRLSGFEALLRWHRPSPDGGPPTLIPPSTFIPLAEETGLIVPIGAWVLNEACRQNKAWQRAGHPPVRVAVNVSAIQFAQADFLDTVVDILRRTDLEPHWLEVEITESLLMQSTQDAIDKLERIRALGVTVAIDDFGTGYSSLAYLRSLPYDTLKIDRSFLKQIGAAAPADAARASALLGGGDKAIVQAIVSLAHGMGKSVVAEGVETAEQHDFLTRIGCDSVQGFLLSVPLTADKAAEVLGNPGLAQRRDEEAA
jgi:diguanylate cyclase (GGDEF)-like protein